MRREFRQVAAAAAAMGVVGWGMELQTADADEPAEALLEAVPDTLTHQGRLMDEDNQPIVGDVELTYTIWDHPTEGSVLWQDVVEIELDDTGFYSVELGGEDNPIDSVVLADGAGWMGISIDGGEEMDPRISLNSVPFALAAQTAVAAGEAEFAKFADEAAAVQPGSIGSEALAEDFEVDTEHVEEATGQTLGGLACSAGDVARFDGTAWSCDDEVGHAETAEFAETAEVAEQVEAGSIGSEALTDGFSVSPAQVDGDTLGGLSCASGEVARFDGNNWFCDDTFEQAVTEVDAEGPIESSGGDAPTISVPRADESTDGYLAGEDFASFDSRIEQLQEGDGISVDGEDISPQIAVEFGDEPGTAVEGDDERLYDAREPLPGSDHYIHSQPDSPQDTSLNIDGEATIGDGVGVGTEAPQAALHVEGTSVLTDGFAHEFQGPTTDAEVWMPLNDGSGTTAADWTPYGHDGTLEGDPQWVDGVAGGAVEFDGENDYIDLGDEAFDRRNDEDWSVSFWMNAYPDVDNEPDILGQSRNRDNTWAFALHGSRLRLELNGSSNMRERAITSSGVIERNQWYHVTGIYHADGDFELWVDGQLEDTGTFTDDGHFDSDSYHANIGRRWGDSSRSFAGKVDSLRVYNRALAPEEIEAIYAATE